MTGWSSAGRRCFRRSEGIWEYVMVEDIGGGRRKRKAGADIGTVAP